MTGADDAIAELERGLDYDPLSVAIRITQAIWRVLKGGVVFDPEELRPRN